jgi:signal transduction histidine kinase
MRALQIAATVILLSTAALTWMAWPGVPLPPALKIGALLLLILWACFSSILYLTLHSGEEMVPASYRESLRSLAREVSRAEERERRRIAQHLHDQLGQSLVALKLKLEILRQSPESDDAAGRWDPVFEQVDEAIEETRTMTFELCPPILYDLGLEAALEWLVTEMSAHNDIEMEVSADGGSSALDDESRSFLFQAARELLTNAIRHAQPQSIVLDVRHGEGEIIIRVKDDGIGIELDQLGSRWSSGSGFGLFNLKERLNHLGGRLQFTSGAGIGTEVLLALPQGGAQGEKRKEREDVLEGTPG